MASPTPSVSSNHLPPVAWGWIASAVVAAVGLLASTITRYGYHRDELYFRMLDPAWGYVDQPPLTPLIARLSTTLFGDTVAGLRVPALLLVALSIVLIALITRELGGGRAAQALAAWAFAFAAFPLTTGHLLLTATVDIPLWAAVLLFVTRALLREQPRWWLAAGAVVGVSMYNKLLIAMLLIGLAVGLVAVGPRRVLRSGWLWAGIGLALVIGAPNLIYQATHEFPQFTMAGALSADNAGEVRAQVLPFQFLLIGPPLAAIWLAGLVALLRREEWRPVRAVAVAYGVALGLTLIGGGQVYYAFGVQAFLLAAGAVVTVDWVGRGAPSRRRQRLVLAAVVVNAVTGALAALPLIPVASVGGSPAMAVNSSVGDQIGWPEYVRAVGAVVADLSPADRARAVLFTGNYGEAGAIDRYGAPYDLPPVYSAQNELYFHGPPPADRTVVVVWSQSFAGTARLFDDCRLAATLDNGFDVDNEEQGSVVAVCRLPAAGWTALWPRLQHYD